MDHDKRIFIKIFYCYTVRSISCIFYIFKYFFFYLILLIIFIVGFNEIYNLKNVIIKILIFFLLAIFIYSIHQIYILENGRLIVIYFLILTWLSDIGGYVFGKLIGGKKINFISPNKTYSGFFGSLLFVQAGGIYANTFKLKFLNEVFLTSFYLFIFTLTVILGDLLFSYFKRKCFIKDYSNFLPGHGGLFDRIDGFIFLTIFVYFVIL